MNSKNTLKYFPRGSKKSEVVEGPFIFNKNEKTSKKAKDDSKFVFTNKKKRVKVNDSEVYNEANEFVIGANRQDNDLEEVEATTNKVSSFKPAKGSLIMMSVCKVVGDKCLILNHSRNRKGYMPATNGKIIGKQVGDFVYGVIVGKSVKQTDVNYPKKNFKLELTDNLNILNTFLSAEKLRKGMQLQGIVESKEDKGYVINLCLKDKSKAFLNYKDYKGKELAEGDEISIILKASKSKSQKIIKWIHRSAIENIEDYAIDHNTEINFECVKPGFLVSAKIESIVDNGLNVIFGKGVKGVIFVDHLQNDLSKYKVDKAHKTGGSNTILARVVSVDFEKKRVELSELEHIVKLAPISTELESGEVMTNIKVLKKVYGNSYKVEAERKATGEKVICFLHKNNIEGLKQVKKEEKNTKKRTKDYLEQKEKAQLESGQVFEFEIKPDETYSLEFNYFDGIPILRLLHTNLESGSARWDTMRGGAVIQGVVKEVVEDDYVSVEINKFITGRIYRTHLTDVPQAKISK